MVVERGVFPCSVLVTGLALRALLAVMLVVFLMAGIALHRGVFVAISRMAGFA